MSFFVSCGGRWPMASPPLSGVGRLVDRRVGTLLVRRRPVPPRFAEAVGPLLGRSTGCFTFASSGGGWGFRLLGLLGPIASLRPYCGFAVGLLGLISCMLWGAPAYPHRFYLCLPSGLRSVFRVLPCFPLSLSAAFGATLGSLRRYAAGGLALHLFVGHRRHSPFELDSGER